MIAYTGACLYSLLKFGEIRILKERFRVLYQRYEELLISSSLSFEDKSEWKTSEYLLENLWDYRKATNQFDEFFEIDDYNESECLPKIEVKANPKPYPLLHRPIIIDESDGDNTATVNNDEEINGIL